HTPFTNNCSATSPPTTSYSSKNGCKCIGFHTGLDSMFSASKASISSVDVTSPCNVIHDNQKFGESHSFFGINFTPSKILSILLSFLNVLRFLSIRFFSSFNCTRKILDKILLM